MTVVTRPVTAEQIEGLPGRCELVDGVVRTLAPAGYEHGRVTGDVEPYVRALGLGDVLGAETWFRIARDPTP